MLDSRAMQTNSLDYELPKNLIAQYPSANRSDARLMVLRSDDASLEHRRISDLPLLLAPGTLLVLNDTMVMPARAIGRRLDTGGKVEALFIEPLENGAWEAMINSRAMPAPGTLLELGGSEKFLFKIIERLSNGRYAIKPESGKPLPELLKSIGQPPLPPYIKRPGRHEDHARYQTVYARQPGAIAAPTAGLHFTRELLKRIEEQRISLTKITLHVGPGTFKPIKSADLAGHLMESERYEISPATAEQINNFKQRGGRIIAVGSTVVRTLETTARSNGLVAAGTGRSDIFLYPPCKFKIVDGMLTNFHLPRSTPLAMVCALAGRERILAAYQEAIKEKYRFYSYGDAMLIL